MARQGEEGVTRTDAYTVGVEKLEIEEGFNLRGDMGSARIRAQVTAFKVSMTAKATERGDKRVSVLDLSDAVPRLKVKVTKEGRILVREGHLRTQALRELVAEGWEIEGVPVENFHGKDEAMETILILTSSEGLKLTTIEKARGVMRLKDQFGWGAKRIAEHLGNRTLSSVEQLLLLANASPAVQQLVDTEKISAATAIEAVRKHKDGAAALLQEQVAQAEAAGHSKLSKRAAAGVVRKRDVKAIVASMGELTAQIRESLGGKLDAILADESVEQTGAVTLKVEIPVSMIRRLFEAEGNAQKIQSAPDAPDLPAKGQDQ